MRRGCFLCRRGARSWPQSTNRQAGSSTCSTSSSSSRKETPSQGNSCFWCLGKDIRRPPRHPKPRRDTLRDVQGEAQMYALGTDILKQVRRGYRKFRKCAPRVQETTTTTTTTKSLHNSSRETLSEYLVNGIFEVIVKKIHTNFKIC
jgi:hypothetical protein